jgi:hypothetical protein
MAALDLNLALIDIAGQGGALENRLKIGGHATSFRSASRAFRERNRRRALKARQQTEETTYDSQI